MSEEQVKYEIIDHEGSEARYYPGSGGIQDVETGKFLANTGGRPGMDQGIGSEIANKRWGDVRSAIIQGLADAATELKIGSIPQDMLAEVVKARAITAASSSGKAGNDAARFIFSIIGTIDEGGKQRSAAMEVKMSDEMAKYVMDKMIED
jgi:hypothetical protein